MRPLSEAETHSLLQSLGFSLGDWGKLEHFGSKPITIGPLKPNSEARALSLFCRHIVTWLPASDRYIVHFEDASALSVVNSSLLRALLLGHAHYGDSFLRVQRRTFGFEVQATRWSQLNGFLFLADVLFATLVGEHHAVFLSEKSTGGQVISGQDGFVYISSTDSRDFARAETLRALADEEVAPKWLVELAILEQQRVE